MILLDGFLIKINHQTSQQISSGKEKVPLQWQVPRGQTSKLISAETYDALNGNRWLACQAFTPFPFRVLSYFISLSVIRLLFAVHLCQLGFPVQCALS